LVEPFGRDDFRPPGLTSDDAIEDAGSRTVAASRLQVTAGVTAVIRAP
jgi:hypothetical protein